MGADTLIGNGGSDILEGGSGDDTYKYLYDGIASVIDTSGNDTIEIIARDFSGFRKWGDGGYWLDNDLIISPNSETPFKLVIKDGISDKKIEQIKFSLR